jgi:hypothetical protein
LTLDFPNDFPVCWKQQSKSLGKTMPDFGHDHAVSFENRRIETIARLCHEANRGICEASGDYFQKSWEQATAWQRESIRKGVRFCLANPGLTAADQHESWMKDKIADGWKWGPEKDAEKKEHPCLIPYEQLPPSQQIKDHVFRAIVLACIDIESC